jgi:5-dehydro-2-deoxygluconokinase
MREGENMTATIGFDKPLYILAFDHRDLILAKSVPDHMQDMLTAEQKSEIELARSELLLAKHIVYRGFEAALGAGVAKDKAGILVDELFGADIIGKAEAQGYTIACPAEKSGQAEFEFEYGEDFARHIETLHPAFCKVLIRYNPEGDQELNRRQAASLKRLSDYLHTDRRSLFLLELWVPPERAQITELKGDRKAYDLELRPRLQTEAIQQLQDAQVEPDVWAVEGLDSHENCEKVLLAARTNGRDKVGCLILCESLDQEKVRERLNIAAGVTGFNGFAVGRTIFSDPLTRWAARKITKQAAAAEIGQSYREFVNIFERGR